MTLPTTCTFCARPFGGPVQRTTDHVIPKSLATTHTVRNKVAACLDCNQFKGAHTPASLRALASDALAGAVIARARVCLRAPRQDRLL